MFLRLEVVAFSFDKSPLSDNQEMNIRIYTVDHITLLRFPEH